MIKILEKEGDVWNRYQARVVRNRFNKMFDEELIGLLCFHTTQIAHNMIRPTILLLLRVYSLLR
jgi:hypothetical protein